MSEWNKPLAQTIIDETMKFPSLDVVFTTLHYDIFQTHFELLYERLNANFKSYNAIFAADCDDAVIKGLATDDIERVELFFAIFWQGNLDYIQSQFDDTFSMPDYNKYAGNFLSTSIRNFLANTFVNYSNSSELNAEVKQFVLANMKPNATTWMARRAGITEIINKSPTMVNLKSLCVKSFDGYCDSSPGSMSKLLHLASLSLQNNIYKLVNNLKTEKTQTQTLTFEQIVQKWVLAQLKGEIGTQIKQMLQTLNLTANYLKLITADSTAQFKRGLPGYVALGMFLKGTTTVGTAAVLFALPLELFTCIIAGQTANLLVAKANTTLQRFNTQQQYLTETLNMIKLLLNDANLEYLGFNVCVNMTSTRTITYRFTYGEISLFETRMVKVINDIIDYTNSMANAVEIGVFPLVGALVSEIAKLECTSQYASLLSTNQTPLSNICVSWKNPIVLVRPPSSQTVGQCLLYNEPVPINALNYNLGNPLISILKSYSWNPSNDFPTYLFYLNDKKISPSFTSGGTLNTLNALSYTLATNGAAETWVEQYLSYDENRAPIFRFFVHSLYYATMSRLKQVYKDAQATYKPGVKPGTASLPFSSTTNAKSINDEILKYVNLANAVICDGCPSLETLKTSIVTTPAYYFTIPPTVVDTNPMVISYNFCLSAKLYLMYELSAYKDVITKLKTDIALIKDVVTRVAYFNYLIYKYDVLLTISKTTTTKLSIIEDFVQKAVADATVVVGAAATKVTATAALNAATVVNCAAITARDCALTEKNNAVAAYNDALAYNACHTGTDAVGNAARAAVGTASIYMQNAIALLTKHEDLAVKSLALFANATALAQRAW